MSKKKFTTDSVEKYMYPYISNGYGRVVCEAIAKSLNEKEELRQENEKLKKELEELKYPKSVKDMSPYQK